MPSDNDIAISVKSLKKSFKVYFDKGQSFKERILFRGRSRYEKRVVLDGISFDVKKGEAVGLIGNNGCGKSTTLKLLTRIMYPDEGSISIKGRVSSLIELGAGFHPDMSGRENIYINSSIFGLTKKEIDSRLESIIEFSELGEYIDNPVRTYSSGMYMRLAFSVAINVDASVLLIDEILAVGDATFQAKCFNRLREIKANGTTIVIVSHSLTQIEQFCDRSIWINNGKIAMEGLPREVHPAYLDYMSTMHGVGSSHETLPPESEPHDGSEASRTTSAADEAATESATGNAGSITDTEPVQKSEKPGEQLRWGNKDIEIVSAYMLDEKGKRTTKLISGRPCSICIEYANHKNLEKASCGIGVFRNDDVQCYGTNTDIDHVTLKLNDHGTVIFEIENNVLLAGEYTIDVALHTTDGFAYDYCRKAIAVSVASLNADIGVERIPHSWRS